MRKMLLCVLLTFCVTTTPIQASWSKSSIALATVTSGLVTSSLWTGYPPFSGIAMSLAILTPLWGVSAAMKAAGDNSIAKVFMIQGLVSIGMDATIRMVFEPFIFPRFKAALEVLNHPPLLKGESTLNFLVRDLYRWCDAPTDWSIAPLLNVLPSDVCRPKTPYVPLDKLIFPSKTKDQIDTVVRVLANAQEDREGFPNVFIHGSFGTGKTAVARAIAEKLRFNFQKVSGSELVHLGNTGLGQLAQAFDWAERGPFSVVPGFGDHRPVMLFVDEVEAFAQDRASLKAFTEGYNVLAEFLARVNNSGSNKYFVVVASNLPKGSTFDSAFMSRFDWMIDVEAPGMPERKHLFELYIKKDFEDFIRRATKKDKITAASLALETMKRLSNDSDLQVFAERADQFSGRDIAVVVNNVVSSRGVDACADDILRGIQSTIDKYKLTAGVE